RRPRPLDADGADQPAAGRRDARAGGGGAADDRGGAADRRPAGDRPRRPGPPRAGRLLDLRRGRADQGGGDRDRAALPRRGAALRQDPADGPRRAPLSGDRRLRSDQQPDRGADRSGRRDHPVIYRHAVRGFSAAFVLIGLVVLTVTLVNGGGPASVGVLMGLAFLAVGVGRLWVARRMEER